MYCIKMVMLIYKIENLENGKCYIGQTSRSIEERFREHCGNSKSSISPKLKNAIKKYGKDCFSVDVIWETELCTQQELDQKEIQLIAEHNTLHPHGYNLTLGGSGGRHSEETKRILSEKSKKMWEEQGENFRENRRKNGMSIESRQKIKESLLQMYRERPEIRDKISASSKNRKVSEETRKLLSEAMKRRNQNPDYIKTLQKISEQQRKKVYCFDINRNLVRVFDALTITDKETGISLSRIRNSIKKGSIVDGFIFSYSVELPAMST